jgi:hypothetical protein
MKGESQGRRGEWARLADDAREKRGRQIGRNERINWRTKKAMGVIPCGWTGCNKEAEATFDGRPLCRFHFQTVATRQLEDHRRSLQRITSTDTDGDRLAVCRLLSEVVSQAPALVTKTKLLAPVERGQFLQLSLAATELFKRIHREPRITRNMPVLIYRQGDSARDGKLTNTIDVSKRGVCVSTKRQWRPGEKIWIQKPTNQQKALARVGWVKATEPGQFIIGLKILESGDFGGSHTVRA